MDNKNMSEISLDDLNAVTGGTSPLLPESDPASANRPFDLGTDASGFKAEPVPAAFAYCKLCGAQVTNLGQTRIDGGNTVGYKCMNPVCGNYNQILDENGVDIP